MPSDKKKLIFFFIGLALIAAALVFGTNFLLKLVPLEETPQGPALPPPAVDINFQAPEKYQAPAVQIQSGAVDRRPITYTINGFKPERIVIQASDDIGCLITVINKSGQILRVGVNPHNEKGDPGADYGIIQPGETGILDVRYPGLSEITLHNHFNPAHEFSVGYGEGCK